MAAQRTSFEKLQRDRNKKAKAAAKRERRQGTDGPAVASAPAPVVDDGGELSATALLELIESIHKQFANKTISAEEFEEKKAELLARLPID